MKCQKQISKWLESEIITQEQAQKMLDDIQNNNENSNRFIIVISTIGSILLGMGSILFIASNWAEMSNIVKIFILLSSTFAAYYSGYVLQYSKKNLPKVGASLIFLGALLFGASIFLIAQMYHVNANAHSLVLIWLIGILPLVYGFCSESITFLSAWLFLIWIGLFIFQYIENRISDAMMFASLPIIYLTIGALFFGIGSLHYWKSEFIRIARVFRILAMQIMMFCLFLLTFKFFSSYKIVFGNSVFGELQQEMMLIIVFFSVLAVLNIFLNLFFNPSKSETNIYENSLILCVLFLSLFFFFLPTQSVMYTLIYNLIFGCLTLFLIFIGYHRLDIKIVNMGIFWLTVFLIARYFDFFWNLFDRSLFFICGGLILIVGGIIMEKKRRSFKQDFLYSK